MDTHVFTNKNQVVSQPRSLQFYLQLVLIMTTADIDIITFTSWCTCARISLEISLVAESFIFIIDG